MNIKSWSLVAEQGPQAETPHVGALFREVTWWFMLICEIDMFILVSWIVISGELWVSVPQQLDPPGADSRVIFHVAGDTSSLIHGCFNSASVSRGRITEWMHVLVSWRLASTMQPSFSPTSLCTVKTRSEMLSASHTSRVVCWKLGSNCCFVVILCFYLSLLATYMVEYASISLLSLIWYIHRLSILT